MKNNFLFLKRLESCDIKVRLPPGNDFYELIATNKLEPECFSVLIGESKNVDDLNADRGGIRFKEEAFQSSESRSLIYAGYVDCMDEAIRFLIEEENISPEHPIVKNLKDYLEKSKEKIFGTFYDGLIEWSETRTKSDIISETFSQFLNSNCF